MMLRVSKWLYQSVGTNCDYYVVLLGFTPNKEADYMYCVHFTLEDNRAQNHQMNYKLRWMPMLIT